MTVRRSVFVACYSASGAAALLYQVVWVRLLTLAFGHTVAASSIVLGAFMCGLALGAWLAGRRPTTPSTALAVYGALEIAIAAAAIVLPAVLTSFEPILAWAYADGDAPTQFAIIRAAIGFAVVGVPAAAMGATFPLAVSWCVDRGVASPGFVYAVNTTGAAFGALGAGLWLIPAVGMETTTWIGVALNLLAAGGAIWLRRLEALPGFVPSWSDRPPQPARRSRAQRPAPSTLPALPYMVAALSGFAALVFEIAWTRLFASILGPTTYAFAIMAAAFIVGIAIGSAAAIRFARTIDPTLRLCTMLAISGVATIAAAWFSALELPLLVARYVAETEAFGTLLAREALIVGCVLIASSAAFGATFTLALSAAPPGMAPTRHTSIVYTANTIAAVIGSLAAGFLIIPRLGLAMTFLSISALLIVGGAALFAVVRYRGGRRRTAAMSIVAAAAMLAAMFTLPPWDEALLAAGTYKYARGIIDDLDSHVRAGRLEYYKEGAAGIVSVKLVGNTRSMAIDGKVDASNGSDMLTQQLLGTMPALMHGSPRDALVIGLGSGVTAHALRAYGTLRRLDVVEISPEVVQASSFFEPENHGVVRAPGVRLLLGDGRTHLQLSSRQYDVIVSEPSNPWISGVAALFTREFFDGVRRRLAPRGIFCQWAHTYEIEKADLRSIIATFASVFPQGTMWLVGDGDLLLIGAADGDINSRVARLADVERKESVRVLLGEAGVPPESAAFVLASLYAAGPGELVSYGRSAPLQSDDRMSLEFTAARAMYSAPEGNAAAIRKLAEGAAQPESIASALSAATPQNWIARGEAARRIEAFGMAHESFRRAAALDVGNFDALRGVVAAAAGAGRIGEEVSWLRAAADASPRDPTVHTALSYALALQGNLQGALAAAMRAADMDRSHPEPLEQLASVLADLADTRLNAVADTLMARFPNRADSRYYFATALLLQDRIAEAEREIDALVASYPRHAKAHNLRGIACGAKGDHACAIAAFERSLVLDATDATVRVNLGRAQLARGDTDAAIGTFREAIVIDPTTEAAREALRSLDR